MVFEDFLYLLGKGVATTAFIVICCMITSYFWASLTQECSYGPKDRSTLEKVQKALKGQYLNACQVYNGRLGDELVCTLQQNDL